MTQIAHMKVPVPGLNTPPAFLRALVVDDVPMVRMVIRAVLEADGLQVEEAGSGLEAISALSRPFDVVLLDCDLGAGDSGLDVLRHVRSRPDLESLPVILMSAVNIDHAHVAHGLLSGAADYVLKPVDPQVLRARVTVACRTRARMHSLQTVVDDAVRSAQAPRMELEGAASLQRASLPTVPCQIGEVRVTGAVVPSFMVSGDLFDIVSDASGRTSAVLLDVAGHGVASALVASAAREVLHRGLCAGNTFAEVVTDLAARMDAVGDPMLSTVSLSLVRIDPDARSLEILNAGMPAVAFGGFGVEATLMHSNSSPVGLRRKAKHPSVVVPIADSGWFLLSSDGATLGSHDPSNVLNLVRHFNMIVRGAEIAGASADEATTMMRQAIDHPDSDPPDDATLVFGAWSFSPRS